jgi:hypothetical protein
MRGDPARSIAASLTFWGCAAAGAILPLAIVRAELFALFLERLGPASLVSMLRGRGALALAIVCACAVAAGLDIALGRLRMRRTAGSSGAARAVAALARAVALFILGSLILSVFIPFPTVPITPWWDKAPATLPYVGRVLAVLATGARLRNPDLLTSTTFWTGLGWQDVPMPAALTVGLPAVTVLSAAVTLWILARDRQVRQLVLLGIFGAACALAAAAYAWTVLTTNADINGRYLCGLYMAGIAVAWHATSRRLFGFKGGIPLALAILGAVHASSLVVLLRRYF